MTNIYRKQNVSHFLDTGNSLKITSAIFLDNNTDIHRSLAFQKGMLTIKKERKKEKKNLWLRILHCKYFDFRRDQSLSSLYTLC